MNKLFLHEFSLSCCYRFRKYTHATANPKIPAPITAKREYVFNSTRIRSHDAPATAPAPMSTVFQIRLPAVVRRRNGSSSIFAIPAGIEIRLRMIGTNRQKKTADRPVLSSHPSVPLLLPAVFPMPRPKMHKTSARECAAPAHTESAPPAPSPPSLPELPRLCSSVYMLCHKSTKG